MLATPLESRKIKTNQNNHNFRFRNSISSESKFFSFSPRLQSIFCDIRKKIGCRSGQLNKGLKSIASQSFSPALLFLFVVATQQNNEEITN